MGLSSPADRPSPLAELQLSQAPQLEAALAALLRGLATQVSAADASLRLDDGVHIHLVGAAPDRWPESAPGRPIHLDGRVAGRLCVLAPARGPEPALEDATRLAEALLETRLREQRLAAQLQREREASAAGSDWLWETDAEGVLTWVSDSVVEHTGWAAGVEIGMHSMNLNRPPPGAEERASWDLYRSQRARHEPFRDGIGERDSAHGPMLVAMSGRPRFDATGRFVGYRGAARDVTAEVAQRQTARQARQLLLQAMDAVHAGLMISGPDGRVLAANAAWQRQVGRFAKGEGDTWESLLRTMVASGLYPDAIGREEEFVRWRLSLATPDATPQELRFADQTVLVCDQRLPDGSTVHLSIDVSERRVAEQLRAESESRLSAVLRAVPDLWFVIDSDDRYQLCSDERHPMLVAPFEQQRGKAFGEVLPSPFDRLAVEALHRARATGELQRLEYDARTLDGELRRFEARIVPMGDGRVLYLTRDLSSLRRLERELQMLQRAVEADTAMPIVVTDATRPDDPVIYVNAAFERLTGYARTEAMGRNCRFLMDTESVQPGLAELRASLAAGRPCTVVLANRRRDGSRFLNELHIVPIRDEAGAVVQHLGVLHDVTERVRSAERLRASEDLYRSVATAISDGLIVTGADGRILTCNPAAGETLGCDPATLTGARLSERGYRLNDEHDRPLTPRDHPVYRVLRGGEAARDVPLVLHSPDGQTRHVLLTTRPLRAGAGSLSCLVTFRDVSERRAAALALEAAERRWRFALEGSGDGVWDFDEDTQQAFFSARWKQMLGHAEHEVGSDIREWTRRIHPDDYRRVMKEVADYREGRSPQYECEYRLRHRDGHWVWILDRGKIVERRPDGTPRRIVGTHTDISRLKQAEQALRDKQAAELASRAKSEFLSRMSHEMRTPLNAVIGFTQLLRLQPQGEPGKVAEYAEHILRASEHLLGLVNEVLDLQRVEEGRASLRPRPVELAPFLEATLELLRPAAQARSIALTHQVPAGRWVQADDRALRQVLMNMVSNAVKYNRAGGWVTVSLLEGSPGRCVIGIEDTGSGLTDDQLARLFQPFERLGHESSGIEGSGLGLVITRSLIEQMGGTVSLSSIPGAGTLARIDLPAADAPATAAPAADVPRPSAPPPPLVERAGLRVLYVEDNRINALLFEEAMRMLGGIELRVAESGAEALALVQGWTPHVLVLDANLPDMNGHELLARLRRLPALAGLPAFMCSADAMPEDLQRARANGFQDYWTKPIEMAKVGRALEALRGDAPA